MRSVTASISTSSRVHPRGTGNAPALARPLLDRERARRRARGCCARGSDVGFGSTARRSPTTSALTAASSSTSRPSSGSTDESCSAMRFRAPSCRASSQSTTPSSTTCARGSRQGRVRGGGRMPSGACLEPDLRLAPRSGASLPAHRSARARGQDPGSGRHESDRAQRSGAACASESRRATRCSRGRVASSTRLVCRSSIPNERPGRSEPSSMTNGVVLHTQKVAGISGSEAHLLQLLPDLRARGWDPLSHVARGRAGAWEFAGELRAWSPLDDVRPRRRRPPRLRGSRRVPLAHATPDPPRTSSTPMSTASSRASSRPVPLSTKHGFNEFREGRWFGLADRSVGSLAHVHIAISQGLAQYLAETEGFAGRTSRSSTTGLRPTALRRRVRGEARLLCVGRLIPIKGHLVLLRALAQARARVPGVTLDVAGRGPRSCAQVVRPGARSGRRRALPRLRLPVEKAIDDAAIVVVPPSGRVSGWSRSRRWSVLAL